MNGLGPPSHAPAAEWLVRGGRVALDRPVVMGIVNLTPDSFSDGGRFRGVEHALDEAEAMVHAGAGLVDVGGESTRPGAATVSVDEETARILPFVEGARDRLSVPVSVDTRKAEVARRALEAGAAIVNDVSALAHDSEMARVVAEAEAGVVLMHMRGEPATMAGYAEYGDVVGEMVSELRGALARAHEAGIEEERIVLDPGIGFAKAAGQSFTVLAGLARLCALGYPVLVGPSRKSFIGSVTDTTSAERVPGTVAACVAAYLQGARIFRVHDVEPVVQGLAVAEAIARAGAAEVPSGEGR